MLNATVLFSEVLNDPGVLLDSQLTMADHVVAMSDLYSQT